MTTTRKSILGLAMAICMLTLPAAVNANIIFSDSFESPVTSNPATLDAPANWDYTTGRPDLNGIFNQTASTPYGDQFLRVFSNGGGWNMVTTASMLNHTIALGEAYTLTLNYGTIVTNRSGNFLVQLLAIDGSNNQSVLASDFRSWTTSNLPSSTASDLFTLSHTAADHAGERLAIHITQYAAATAHAIIDNIQLDADATLVPEPASLALLGLGGLLMIKRSRA
ncbi:MAG: PEP-CTERM sorting domain-containing protein [Phycisphaera sp.]|nr:PEP-CTERM sorting domain-containing protein [Phycisphaera sp.]